MGDSQIVAQAALIHYSSETAPLRIKKSHIERMRLHLFQFKRSQRDPLR